MKDQEDERVPSVGDLVREQRAALRVTLAALAARVGCARSYLSLIENNQRAAPSEEILAKLEGALGFAPGRLVQAARWEAMPEEVRREVAVARRLADILGASGLDEQGRLRGSLDRAYRTGELRRLVESIGEDSTGGAPVPLGQESIDRELPVQVPLINKVAAGYPADFTDLGFPARVADEYVRGPDVGDPDAFAARVVGDSMMPEYREGDVVVFSPAREVKSGMDCYARLEPDQQSTFKRVYFEEGEAGGAIRLQPLNPAYPARVVAREGVAGLYAAVSVTRVL
jgi:SOS-response transcriptional repressor LexA